MAAASTKALGIPEILEQIIYKVFEPDHIRRSSGTPRYCNCLGPGVGKDCRQKHLNCILVSKAWAEIVITKFWNTHAGLQHYIGLLYDEPVGTKVTVRETHGE